LLPAVNAARESGRRTACNNNLKQIVLAIANYETANKTYPPGRVGADAYSASPPFNSPTGVSRNGASGFVCILPLLDSMPLYNSLMPQGANSMLYPADNNWNPSAVAQSLSTRPPVFVCTSDIAKPQSANVTLTPQPMTSSYAMVLGSLGPSATEVNQKYYNTGPFVYMTARSANDIRDGLSNTFFVGETIDGDTPGSLNCWPLAVAYLCSLRSTTNPLNTQSGSGTAVTVDSHNGLGLSGSVIGGFASRHPGGANFAYGGGNAKFVSSQIDFAEYQALSTINGGETIPADDFH